jgi:hypothetical protein
MTDHYAAIVVHLKNDGSNYTQWSSQLNDYASLIGAHSILHGSQSRPTPITDQLYPKKAVLPPTATAAEQAQLDKVYQNKLKALTTEMSDYNKLKKEANDEVEKWDQRDASLRLVIYNTSPLSVVDAVKHIKTASEIYEIIGYMFKVSKCLTWAEFFNLRSSHCSTTKEFTDKFMVGISSLKNMGLALNPKGEVYQFITAIEKQYPEYAKARRHDLRENRDVTVRKMVHEINAIKVCSLK